METESSLSVAAEDAASTLSALKTSANLSNSARAAAAFVSHLRELIDSNWEPLNSTCNELMAGDPSDIVTFSGRNYPSAHHAVFGEARRILARLKYSLNNRIQSVFENASVLSNDEF